MSRHVLWNRTRELRGRIFSALRELSRTLPCGVVTAGILCSVLPVLLVPGVPALAVLLPPLASLVLLPILGAKRTGFQFALPCLLAMASLNLHEWRWKQEAVGIFAGFRPALGVIGELTVLDPSVCGDRLKWMPNPKSVRCRLERAKISAYDDWKAVGGTVMLILPDGAPHLAYGDRIRAEGVLRVPGKPLLPDSFDYGNYLKIRSIRYLFYADAPLKITGRDSTWMGHLLNFRDLLLDRMLTPVPDHADRMLGAAMLFGCRHGIEPQTRQDFIRSGTIHILTVSGLHIGMFAGVMFLLLAFLPFRVRCIAVPVLTFFYALSTGLEMPAFRALTMLSVWCILRAFLLRSTLLNSVLLACGILLIWNPFQIADAGFQYSFLTVLFLVISLPAVSEWTGLISEKRKWMPPDQLTRADSWTGSAVRRLLGSLAGCIVAWLASFGLTLIYQGISVPFSVLTNFLILPLSWLVFFVFCIGSLAGWLIPPLFSVGGRILHLLCGMINGICGFFASLGDFVTPPPMVWTILLFLLLLLLLLRASSKRVLLPSCFLLGCLLFFWCSELRRPEAELVVMSGAGMRIPCLIASVPAYDFSVMINAPDPLAAGDAVNYLKSRGHTSLSHLILSSGSRAECGGAERLFSFLRVEQLILPEPLFQAVTVKEALAAAEKNDVKIHFMEGRGGQEKRFFSGKVKTFVKKDQIDFEFSCFDFKIMGNIREEESYSRITVHDRSGKILKSFHLPLTRERQFSRLQLGK